MRVRSANILILTVLLAANASITKSEVAQERHRFPISIANPAPSDALRNGPLFKKIDQLSYSTSKTSFTDNLAQNAVVSLHPKALTLTAGSQLETFFHVLLKDCQGPYSIDEGGDWVQTSWVCHIGEDRQIKNYFAFKDSPEISAEFKFEDGKISKVFAADILPLPIPGKNQYLPMNAAETIPDKRQ